MQTHRNLYTGIHFTISILDLFLQKKYQFDFFPALSHGAACYLPRTSAQYLCRILPSREVEYLQSVTLKVIWDSRYKKQ